MEDSIKVKRNEFTEVVRRLLNLLDDPPSHPEFISFPTILLKKPRSSHRWSEPGSHTAADSMITWFRANGLAADRTRQNFNGYPELLRKLDCPPPWTEMRMEDMSKTSPARSRQLRPLHIQKEDCGEEEMMRQFRMHRHAVSQRPGEALGREVEEATSLANEIWEAEFRELLALGTSIGSDVFDTVYSAVFEYPEDDLFPAPGAPDLLVWHPAGVPGAWFFSEVKGPGDRLQESQKAWLDQNRRLLSGHFLLTLLE